MLISTAQKRLAFFAAFICLFLFGTYTVQKSNAPSHDNRYGLRSDKMPKIRPKEPIVPRYYPKKLIADWTTFYGTELHQYPETYTACPELNCEITSNKSRVHEADAVLFSLVDVAKMAGFLPSKRMPQQRYIAWAFEPANIFSNHGWYGDVLQKLPPHFFNWTAFYRTDSDIYVGIDFEQIQRKKLTVPSLNSIRQKSKLVFWVVSTCSSPSQRMSYAKMLRRQMPVDIFGKCGQPFCSKGIASDKCFKDLSQQYFFYLAFENSLCKDYVTEKLQRTLELDVVPIVLKRYIYKNLLPDDAFIAVDDFKEPYAMAQFLKYLSQNLTAYLTYFRWRTRKPKPLPSMSLNRYQDFRCKVCAKLQLSNEEPKTISNMYEWFVNQSKCEDLRM